MHPYLFRAVNPAGQPVAERIEAEGLRDARRRLEARGYRDIEFLEDENQADIMRMVAAGGRSAAPLPPAQEAALHAAHGEPSLLWWVVKQHLVLLGPLALWNGFALHEGRPFSGWEIAGFVATPLYALYAFGLSLPLHVFNRMLDAYVQCDWPRFARSVGHARGLRRWLRVPLPESDLLYREAASLAARGDLPGALEHAERARTCPGMTEWMHLNRVSACYEYAGDFEAMVRCLRDSQAKAPPGASAWIDLGNALVSRLRDVAGAKACFAQARQHELPLLVRAGLDFGEGVVGVEEGRWVEAEASLTAAIEALAAYRANPLMRGLEMEIHAHLALAAAGRGEAGEARRYAALARPLLQRRREHALLARLAAAVPSGG